MTDNFPGCLKISLNCSKMLSQLLKFINKLRYLLSFSRSPEQAESIDKMNDNSTWMEELPAYLHDVPLTMIAIPGSHDSFTYDIKPNNEICKECLDPIIKYFVRFRVMRSFIYNWSVTQSLDVRDQLGSGIRYFDIRIAAKRGKEGNEFFLVHGMYAGKALTYFEEIKKFLLTHKKEIVILDINHFYNMSKEDHIKLTEDTLKIFGSMVCPVRKPVNLSLKWMWTRNYQVILIYRKPFGGHNKFLWPRYSIRSRWPQKASCNEVLNILEEEWNRNQDLAAKFRVYQVILTPDKSFILKRLSKTLKEALAGIKAFDCFARWVHSRKQLQDSLAQNETLGPEHQANIFMCDFVEQCGFADDVIKLNESRWAYYQHST